MWGIFLFLPETVFIIQNYFFRKSRKTNFKSQSEKNFGRAPLKSSPTAVDGNEANLMTIMKQLAVVPVAVSIRRSELLACRQDHGESGRAYYAKLMGKAATCSYTVKCSSDTCDHVTDFTDIIVKDVLVFGG